MERIEEILVRLDAIIEETRAARSPLGYFAALYFNMTDAIRRGIADGVFENGSRMERLDILFAKRYLDAYDAWKTGAPVTESWRVAFEAARNPDLAVLQHLILGINAHINLDLGIAAAQTRPGEAIIGLKKDFEKVNDIIAGLTDRVQDRLAEIFLPFRLLDRLLKTEDEGWIDFSIVVARRSAWQAAQHLAFIKDKTEESRYIEALDKQVAVFGKSIARPPGFLLRIALWLMRWGERSDTAAKIEKIRAL
jgi:Family of unknown function (DUF5995)